MAKSFSFCASHQLDHLPPEHQCARLHGHNYTVVLVLQDEALNEDRMVLDFGQLRAFKLWVDTSLDHRHLNDVCPGPTTSENLARWLYEAWSVRWPQLVAVRVRETEATSAEYWRPGAVCT